MGFRISKRIKLMPGVSLNISKTGVSTSIGPKGAKLTVGKGRKRATVGLPGTGISHSTNLAATDAPRPTDSGAGGAALLGILAGLFGILGTLFGTTKKRRR